MHDQAHDPDSLFRRMRTLIERYRDTPELAWGAYEVLDADDPGVLAHISSLPEGAVLALHNFSGREVTATTNVPGLKGGRLLTDIFTGDTVKSAAGGLVRTELEPYGYRWLRAPAECPQQGLSWPCLDLTVASNRTDGSAPTPPVIGGPGATDSVPKPYASACRERGPTPEKKETP